MRFSYYNVTLSHILLSFGETVRSYLDLAERYSATEGGCIFQLHFLVRNKVQNSFFYSYMTPYLMIRFSHLKARFTCFYPDCHLDHSFLSIPLRYSRHEKGVSFFISTLLFHLDLAERSSEKYRECFLSLQFSFIS